MTSISAIPWESYTLRGLVEMLSPQMRTSMVPEFENVALYLALREHGWPGEFVRNQFKDDSFRTGVQTVEFLRWKGEVFNAKMETPLDVVDGRYTCLRGLEDLHSQYVVPAEDGELESAIPSLFDPIMEKLNEIALLNAVPPARHIRTMSRI